MNETNGASFETPEKRIEELEKQNKKLKEQVLNVKDACYCELCYGLEKQNEELVEFIVSAYTNNIDNRFNDYAKELLEKIKQKPIEEILKEVSDGN